MRSLIGEGSGFDEPPAAVQYFSVAVITEILQQLHCKKS